MWEIIRELVADGVTIFLTTQYLEEADRLADRIAVLDHGRLIARGHAGRAQAARPRRPHPAALRRPARARAARPRALGDGARDDEALTLRGAERRQRRRRCARCSTASTTDVDRGRRPHRAHARPRRRLPRTSPGSDHDEPTPSRDSATMLRRNLRHVAALPGRRRSTRSGIPVVLLLLFVLRLRRHARRRPARRSGGRGDYVDYLAPGHPPARASSGAAQSTAIAVAMDMTEGIIARFRTMAICPRVGAHRPRGRQPDPDAARASSVVTARGAARSASGPTATRAATGSARSACSRWSRFALTWLSVALGLVAKSVEAASNLPLLLILPAVPRQRLRPDRLDARRRALVRREPAVHADHRDAARAADRHRRSGQRRGSPSPGALAIGLGSYVWAKHLYDR